MPARTERTLMADNSKIQWTDATWNPTVGCKLVSPGCTNCYAMKLAGRLERMGGKTGAKYAGLTAPSKAGPIWTGTIRLDEAALLTPLRWKKPRRIFVNSMSDLFAEDLPDAAIDTIFAVMQRAPRHIFQVLTKRSDRMKSYVAGLYADADSNNRRWFDRGFCWPLGNRAEMARDRVVPFRNIWLGVSVEDQQRADERIPNLLATPAPLRFISAEPLLGPVDVRAWLPWKTRAYEGNTSIDWVIAGGESGRGARPMHPDWARALRDQCAAAGVPFFFKQWGEFLPFDDAIDVDCADVLDGQIAGFGGGDPGGNPQMVRLGKKKAGRRLDGREHSEFPSAAA